MKHSILLYGLFFFISIRASAQVLPIYFVGNKITTNKDKATSFAIYGKLSDEDIWVFKRYDLQNNLLQTGSYNDEQLSRPHGKFIFYSSVEEFNNTQLTTYKLKGKTRFVSQEGNFVNGLEEGKWVLYYPDGTVFSSQEFSGGKLNGESITYNKFGEFIVKGNLINGLKEGVWYYEKGKKKVVYEHDVVKSTVSVQKKKVIVDSLNTGKENTGKVKVKPTKN